MAGARDLPLQQVLAIVEGNTTKRGLGLLGESGVNVLDLNVALDNLKG